MTETVSKDKQKGILWIVFLSIVAIIWWACIWNLFENGLDMIVGHRKGLHQFCYLLIAILIFFTFYEYPHLLV
jgi:hypothetical protein